MVTEKENGDDDDDNNKNNNFFSNLTTEFLSMSKNKGETRGDLEKGICKIPV